MNKLLLAIALLIFGSGLSAQEKERAFSFHFGSGMEIGVTTLYDRTDIYSYPGKGGIIGGTTEFGVNYKNKGRIDFGVRNNSLIPFYVSLFDNSFKNRLSPYACAYKLIPINENLNIHLGGCVDWYLHKDQRVGVDEYKNIHQFGGGPLIGVGSKRLRIDILYIPKFNEEIDSFGSIALVQNKFTVKVMYDYLNFPRIRKKKNE